MVEEIETPQQSRPSTKSVEIDSIFEMEGKFTRFNILLHTWGFLVSITIGWSLGMTVFTGANPDWKFEKNCTFRPCNTHVNKSFTNDHGRSDERCKLQRNEWKYVTDKRYSFVTEFDLICEKKTLAALISSSVYIGGIIGSSFSGMIADNFGRKPVLISSLSTFFFASFSGYYIENVWELFITNIIAGVAQVACYYTLFTYVLELVAPKHRVVSNSILQTGLVVSFFFIDIIAYYVRDWNKIKLYLSFPCLLPLIFSYAIPESPRWLLSKGKVNEAKFVLYRIINFNQSKQRVGSLSRPTEEKSKTYMELFRTLSLFTLTLSVAFVRFVVYAVYFILLFDSPNLGGDLYQSFALALIPDIISCLSYPLYANRIGRRKALFGSLLLTATLSFSMSFIPQAYPYRYEINMFLLILAIFSAIIAIVTMSTWVFEIFPTCLRARGMFICIMSERVGIVVAPFVVRLLSGTYHNFPFYIVSALSTLAVIISYFVLPETRNRPTRENKEDFQTRMKKQKNITVVTFDNVAIEIDVMGS